MTAALVQEARAAGASLWLAGDDVAFRFPDKPPSGLLPRLRQGKAEIIAVLLAEETQRWRSENPMPASGRDACCYCDKPAPCTSILAGAPGEHAWIHRECLEPMNRSRQEEALAAVRALLGFDIGAGQCKR